MTSFSSSTSFLVTLAVVLFFAGQAHAFGAGNIGSISKIEGLNWRHGDIEDTLLTLLISRAAGGGRFSKMDVARVYFGNWLRDYSQAIDVGTVKYVSAEAIRILLWVLGFMTFGYGTKEFEVTSARLGCYRPEDHIDNPKDYADNLDAREYDPRLRGPVNEKVELAIDQRRGMKNYIASEEARITTSAGHVRKLFSESIRLGRQFARTGNKADLYEALRLLGTGCHCLEDFSAHSNYTELALIEMGETETFPHVGRRTQIRLDGAQRPVYPLVTGTFGGVDFLHSVCGEFSDKAEQSEIQELAGTMQEGSRGDTSLLKDLLNKLPSGLLGGGNPSGKAEELQANATTAQMQNMHVTPKQPEAFTRQMNDIVKQIYPVMEWHDEIMQQITEAIEKIPVLPELIEQVTEQINVFVFSLLAPFVLPIITQIQNELQTGSSEVIASSKDKQLIVFYDDNSTDPTHSMLSKDHFSNILNEVAGKIASQVLKWVVPQLIQCWDDERVDADRTINRIINGVLHHPAQRNMGEDNAVDGRRLMFQVVENWWRSKSEYEKSTLRQQLSREGVQSGANHKEGVQDSGHGCCKPLGMPKAATGSASGGAASAIMGALSGGSSSGQHGGNNEFGRFAEEAVGGGALGGIVGALAGGVGADLLGGVFGNKEKKAYSQQGVTAQGGYQQSYTEYGANANETAQARYEQTNLPSGVQRTEYERYEQPTQGGTGAYGYEVETERKPMPGGGYEENVEKKYERPGGEEDVETWRQGRTADGRHYQEIKHHKSHHSSESGSEDERKSKHHGKHHKKKKSYGSGSEEEDRPEQYQPPREEPRGYGEQEYGRPSYGGERERFQEPPRQEFGGGYGGGRERFEEPPRQEFGRESGGGYQEPPRQEFGGGPGRWGERGNQESRFEEPPREGFGGGRGYGAGGFGGERNEWEQERQEEQREEYQEEQREEFQDQEEGYGERRRW